MLDNENQKIFSSPENSSVELRIEEQKIIGTWTNCATNYNGVMRTANVCTTIELKPDNSGRVIYPSQEIQTFGWTLKNDMLTIQFAVGQSESYGSLSESPYQVHLTENKKSLDLELKSKTEKTIYYLARQK